jgi:UDP-2-acetamido-2-deoxy-ribo-hexuluronate aminotransferase
VLLAKLTVFADELVEREKVARYYDSRLGNAVVTPARVKDSTSVWAIYAILLRDAAVRDHVQASLRADGVPTAIYYPRPLHLQPAYREHHDGVQLPVSEELAQRILALPIHPDLSEADMAHVCDRVLAALG